MKMRTIFKLFAILIFTYSNAQNFQTQKIVVDLLTKLPLENVIISNQKDYSTTNIDGKFIFVSANKAINLNLLGYENIETTFDDLKNLRVVLKRAKYFITCSGKYYGDVSFDDNKIKNKLYLIEVNYYSGGGSKLKATAGEYKELHTFLKAQNITFIWITDGLGWQTAKSSLEETFNHNDYVINIEMLKNGILEEICK